MPSAPYSRKVKNLGWRFSEYCHYFIEVFNIVYFLIQPWWLSGQSSSLAIFEDGNPALTQVQILLRGDYSENKYEYGHGL